MSFIEKYKFEITYAIVVISIGLIFFFLTNLIYRLLSKKKLIRFPNSQIKSLRWVKRILNILWLVLGIIAMSYIFVKEQYYGTLGKNFEYVLYLGILTVITIFSASTTNYWFLKKIRKKIENDEDPTSYKFLRYVTVTLICLIGILFGILIFPSLRGIAQTALGGAGVMAIVIGVASQEALANLVGGVFIIAFKPFKVGDIIKVNDTMVGFVSDITLRHTVIKNFENKMIVIPNAVINKEKLINYDLGELKCCERIEIGISYDSSVVLAKRIMREECENHPFIYDNRTPVEILDGEPIVRTALISMNDSSVTIRAWAWAKNFEDAFQLNCDVLESIKARFEAEGIEIPFPHRTIVMKTPK